MSPSRIGRVRSRRQRGSAIVVALVASVSIVAVGVGLSVVSVATQRDDLASRQRYERRLVADAGLARACAELVAGGDGNLGTADAQIAFGVGSYFTTTVQNADGTRTVTATGRVGRRSRTLCAVLRERRDRPFYGAIYAGNASAASGYTLVFGGTGSRADEVSGDVYSGGNITVSGNASIDGDVRAAGTVSGIDGTSGVTEPGPDLVGAHYESNHDVNVAAEFSAHGTSTSNNSLGGTAIQVPESNPAHIFRKNPSDRSAQTSATTKNDYFLEDPYEQVKTGNSTNPNNATKITLSGVGGEPGTSANDKVFFIDGNLWVHNLNLYSFVVDHALTQGVRLTIVVKGNIYISDNLVLRNPVKDGLALIAVKDSAVSNSGNIYFGDPVFGTLEEMDAFMYAENNFYDNNLGTSGSPTIVVKGMMSAANQVAISHGSGSSRTKLDLTYDTRIRDGTLSLPGLPEILLGGGRPGYSWVAAYEVAGRD